MLPLVAMLLKSGFSVLAGAVASSGKELIQDKLGVNIEDALGSEDGRLKLKQEENRHEEFLINAAQTTDARDLDYFQEEIKDKADARDREIEMEKLRSAPWWAPSTQTILTFLVVLGCGYLFQTSAQNEVKYAVIAIATMVLQYYYGTTSSSRGKDSVIAKMADKQEK